MVKNRENSGKVGKGHPPKHTQFKKGQSGNPKGRPNKIPAIDELLAEVLGEEKDGKTAAQAILMALSAKAAKGDVRAAEVLFDRAYGKAKQDMNIKQDGVITVKYDGGVNNLISPAPQEPGDNPQE